MEFKNINCPECGLNIEYWTKNNFIECTKCKNKIKVEPCKDIVDEVIDDGEIEILPETP
jgi:peptide subunit release factor 1 (eRF1)